MHNSVNKNLHQLQLKKLEISSNVNEVISAVLNSLFFFYRKISHAPKAPKAQRRPGKSTKTQLSE